MIAAIMICTFAQSVCYAIAFIIEYRLLFCYRKSRFLLRLKKITTLKMSLNWYETFLPDFYFIFSNVPTRQRREIIKSMWHIKTSIRMRCVVGQIE